MASRYVEDILNAWQRGKSALLYGPPGTGKTRILSELLAALNEESAPVGELGLDMSDGAEPFKSVDESSSVRGGGPPRPVKTVWLTFHQSLTYEDFVIGLRPESNGGVVSLVPQAGTLLDAVLELQGSGGAQSVVLFIDEINRGNAAKIFGEFLTFLDFEYRDTTPDGSENPTKLPLPIRHLTHDSGAYAQVRRSDGSEASLAYPSHFPRHIYVVATMNSVDRTAIPIDSALARRFDRIDIRPDTPLLAERWGVDMEGLGAKAGIPTTLTASETAILLIDRLNLALAENFGPDFELGHGLVIDLDPADADPWAQLARIWDRVLFPQLEDRFSGRAEELANALRVEEFGAVPYAWRFRTSISGDSSTSVIAPVSLSAIDPTLATTSLQLLASRSLGQ
jgi:5-methylcytosine-specific restriction enzyme B